VERKIGEKRLSLVQADLTEQQTDAIVNAANTRLQHGGGVAAAIVRKGGAAIQQESDRIGHCPRGGAVLTGAGRLACRHVIHTVGPMMGDGDEDAVLRACVRSCLELAAQHGLNSVAFPAISTGIYGVPVSAAAHALLSEALRYLSESAGGPEQVIFCLYADADLNAFRKALSELD
jgi:O-acetyl-ADP-ribose deacetylase (regulator of RNase III)